MLALLVSIINGIFDIAYNMQRTFEASVTNDYGESLSVKVIADSGRPSLLGYLGQKLYKSWCLAWRVGTTLVSTVNIGITITPSATNVVNLKVTYYVKAKCGTHEYKPLSATQISASSGSSISNSTGSISINDHLQDLGVSTTQDQTVDYYVYCKVEGDGAISGEHLVAEVSETKFDTVTYDYGSECSGSLTTTPIGDAYVYECNPNSNFGSSSYLHVNPESGQLYRSYLKFDISSIMQHDPDEITKAELKLLYVYKRDIIRTLRVHRVTGSWSETGITWNNQPSWSSSYVSKNVPSSGNVWWTIDVTSISVLNDTISFVVKDATEDSTEGTMYYFYSKDYSNSNYHPKLYVEYKYTDWSVSWSWFNLPLSVVSLPIGQQFLAAVFMVLAFTVWAAAREKARRRRRRK